MPVLVLGFKEPTRLIFFFHSRLVECFFHLFIFSQIGVTDGKDELFSPCFFLFKSQAPGLQIDPIRALRVLGRIISFKHGRAPTVSFPQTLLFTRAPPSLVAGSCLVLDYEFACAPMTKPVRGHLAVIRQIIWV